MASSSATRMGLCAGSTRASGANLICFVRAARSAYRMSGATDAS